MCLLGMAATIAPVVERMLCWSAREDHILLKHVAQFGATNWDASLALQELGVPAAACAVRFLALISSAGPGGNPRKPWREEELEVLIKAYQQVRPMREDGRLGAQVFYHAISCFLPGRTASAVRQAVNVKLKEMRGDELQCSPEDFSLEAWQEAFAPWLAAADDKMLEPQAKQLAAALLHSLDTSAAAAAAGSNRELARSGGSSGGVLVGATGSRPCTPDSLQAGAGQLTAGASAASVPRRWPSRSLLLPPNARAHAAAAAAAVAVATPEVTTPAQYGSRVGGERKLTSSDQAPLAVLLGLPSQGFGGPVPPAAAGLVDVSIQDQGMLGYAAVQGAFQPLSTSAGTPAAAAAAAGPDPFAASSLDAVLARIRATSGSSMQPPAQQWQLWQQQLQPPAGWQHARHAAQLVPPAGSTRVQHLTAVSALQVLQQQGSNGRPGGHLGSAHPRALPVATAAAGDAAAGPVLASAAAAAATAAGRHNQPWQVLDTLGAPDRQQPHKSSSSSALALSCMSIDPIEQTLQQLEQMQADSEVLWGQLQAVDGDAVSFGELLWLEDSSMEEDGQEVEGSLQPSITSAASDSPLQQEPPTAGTTPAAAPASAAQASMAATAAARHDAAAAANSSCAPSSSLLGNRGQGTAGWPGLLPVQQQQQQQQLQLGVYRQLHRPDKEDGAAVRAAWFQQEQESLPGLPYTPPGTHAMAGPNWAPAMPTPGPLAQARSSLIAAQQDLSALISALGPSSSPPQAAGAGSSSTELAGGSVAMLAPAGTRQVQQDRLAAFESTLAAMGGMIGGIYKLCRTVSSRPTPRVAETCRFMMQQVEMLQQQQQWLTEQMEEEGLLGRAAALNQQRLLQQPQGAVGLFVGDSAAAFASGAAALPGQSVEVQMQQQQAQQLWQQQQQQSSVQEPWPVAGLYAAAGQ